ncbi:MAG: hypothetical protein WCA35_06380, partial [Kovacikia sp.]
MKGGIMDPGLAPKTQEFLSVIDLQAMDVIGWDLVANSSTLKIDLSALTGQAQQALAGRLGQTVTWLNANATTAATRLSQDRSQDIVKMVQNSQIYNWGTTKLNPFRQVIDMMSRQEVYSSFQTIETMCSCTLCKQSAQTSLSDALGSSALKTNGWLGGKLGNLSQNGPSETIDPSAARLIRQFVHAIALNPPQLEQVDAQPTPASTAEFVMFSGTQLTGTESKSALFRGGQLPLGQTQRYFLGASARRPEASAPRSDTADGFDLSLDALASFKPG